MKIYEWCRVCKRPTDKLCNEKGYEYNTKDHLALIRYYKNEFMCSACYKDSTTCIFCNNIVSFFNIDGTRIQENGAYAICHYCYQRLNCWNCYNCQDSFLGAEEKIPQKMYYGTIYFCSDCAKNPNKKIKIQADAKHNIKKELIKYRIKVQTPNRIKPPIKVYRKRSLIEFTFEISPFDWFVENQVNEHFKKNIIIPIYSW